MGDRISDRPEELLLHSLATGDYVCKKGKWYMCLQATLQIVCIVQGISFLQL